MFRTDAGRFFRFSIAIAIRCFVLLLSRLPAVLLLRAFLLIAKIANSEERVRTALHAAFVAKHASVLRKERTHAVLVCLRVNRLLFTGWHLHEKGDGAVEQEIVLYSC